MYDPDPPFRAVRRRDGYLPLEDLGLIGDGTTAALVGLDGSIPWMCLPRFDSDPVFCALLDHARGGHFTVAPRIWWRPGSTSGTAPISPRWRSSGTRASHWRAGPATTTGSAP
ncbi:trehalase-like domain-containing protein [Streptomyces griseofuscus]|uniref:trehalase-like domain-containing protein n=1 Tax=Streptomyces griseofuscus TaxID=146922 RepID=UPI00382E7A7E